MLEFPFVKHFSDAKQEGPSLRLKINPDVGLSEQRKQLEFIRTLFEMKLVSSLGTQSVCLMLPIASHDASCKHHIVTRHDTFNNQMMTRHVNQ